MPDTPMAVAKCVLPVPGPPTRTTFCAGSVNAVSASVWTSLRSTGDPSKSKPARSRCTGNLAACIWWLTERIARSAVSACSRCSTNQRDVSSPALLPCSIRSTQAVAMPCRRRPLSSTVTSRMIHPLDAVGAQAVVAGSVGQRLGGHLQHRRRARRHAGSVQTAQHVDDDALLPARGNVAEVRVEQVVRAHHGEARIDDSPFTLLDPVDGGLHVVVDAAARDAAKCGEAARV